MDALISITLWNVILLAALLSLQPFLRIVKHGPRYALSNFDERLADGVFARRLAMVRSNQVEALGLWVPVVFVAALVAGDVTHPHLSFIATVFLMARLAYAAVSLAGVPFARSGAWIVGFAAWGYLTWIVAGALV